MSDRVKKKFCFSVTFVTELLFLLCHNILSLCTGVLQVCFSQPRMATSLFVFLASVGTSSGDHLRPSMTIHLGDINGHNHFLGESVSDILKIYLGISVKLTQHLPFFLCFCEEQCINKIGRVFFFFIPRQLQVIW